MNQTTEVIEYIENFNGSIEVLKKDSEFKRKINNMAKILGININL